MSIKTLVNDPKLYNALLEELDKEIELQRRGLEQCEDAPSMYRKQGAIKVLRKLKLLREAING